MRIRPPGRRKTKRTGTYEASRPRCRLSWAFSSFVQRLPVFLCFMRRSMNPWISLASLRISSLVLRIRDLIRLSRIPPQRPSWGAISFIASTDNSTNSFRGTPIFSASRPWTLRSAFVISMPGWCNDPDMAHVSSSRPGLWAEGLHNSLSSIGTANPKSCFLWPPRESQNGCVPRL